MKNQTLRLKTPFLAAFIVLTLLLPCFFAMTTSDISPFLEESPMVSKKWQGWHWLLLISPIVAAGLLGSHWIHSQKLAPAVTHQVQQAAAGKQEKREYVLEVIGLGVTLDKYRQGKLWEALQKGNAYTSIREQNKDKYPWDAREKSGISGGRAGDALENGAKDIPMYFAVPVFNADPPIPDPAVADMPDAPVMGLAADAIYSGMTWHLFVVGPRRFDEHPDHILEDIFAFFDANPDVPYIVLNSEDSMATRHAARLPDSPDLLKNGRYIPEMPDASALFVLARRERIDTVRKFAYDDAPPEASVDDLNTYGVARRLYLAY
ncbi:DUF2875 family protein, partial [Janthinobacterium sp. S3M3]|uniref:type VI lipase adapter Tla3 domain-containing protein n=1 Tax=Janthinobacterium sp. S3M3 TaxID=2723078 RepID=UPI0016135E59